MSTDAASRYSVRRVETSLPSVISAEVRDGSVLAGDDFTGDQLTRWFAQEKEAFFQDDSGNSGSDAWYAHMRSVNERLGFSLLAVEAGKRISILILGPGSGIEVASIAARYPEWELYFVEASENFKSLLKSSYPRSHIVDAEMSGDISVPAGSQDVVCAFSVLHHIPNVSYVVREAFRVLKPGGLFLVREPCSSMGDWRQPRSATPNERGISRKLLTSIAASAGFELHMRPRAVLFAPLNALFKRIHAHRVMNSAAFYWLDRLCSWLVSMNDYYWRDAWYKRLGPSAYFYVLRRPKGVSHYSKERTAEGRGTE